MIIPARIFSNFKFLNFIGIGMARGECIIIKKSIFDELNGFNSLLAAGEDFDLFYRVSKKHKTLFGNYR